MTQEQFEGLKAENATGIKVFFISRYGNRLQGEIRGYCEDAMREMILIAHYGHIEAYHYSKVELK